MLTPQQYHASILMLSNKIYNDLLAEKAEQADIIIHHIQNTLKQDEPDIGASLLALSFLTAKSCEQLAHLQINTAGRTFGNLILTATEQKKLIHDACLSVAGKLVGHFMQAMADPEMNGDLGSVN